MNTVHAAREAAPVFTPRKQHPVDRICEAQFHIKGMSVALKYALEKSEQHDDGPTHEHVGSVLDAICALSERIDEALDEICLNYDVKPVLKEVRK